MNYRFTGKYLFTGELELITGLHIGAQGAGFEIGGVDNPVLRDPLTQQPYIPGSSLKGKLRSLLEWYEGSIAKHPKHHAYTAHFCGECVPCQLFGVSSDDEQVRETAGPTRVTVRDARLTPDSAAELEQWLGEGLTTELKTENFLNRVTSEANPRTTERVPAGAVFGMDLVFDVYREPEDKALLKSLFVALALLEDSALGGSGTRGYGKVRLRKLRVYWRGRDFYVGGAEQKIVLEATRLLRSKEVDETIGVRLRLDQDQFENVRYPDSPWRQVAGDLFPQLFGGVAQEPAARHEA